jgi:hypothetical protein
MVHSTMLLNAASRECQGRRYVVATPLVQGWLLSVPFPGAMAAVELQLRPTLFAEVVSHRKAIPFSLKESCHREEIGLFEEKRQRIFFVAGKRITDALGHIIELT